MPFAGHKRHLMLNTYDLNEMFLGLNLYGNYNRNNPPKIGKSLIYKTRYKVNRIGLQQLFLKNLWECNRKILFKHLRKRPGKSMSERQLKYEPADWSDNDDNKPFTKESCQKKQILKNKSRNGIVHQTIYASSSFKKSDHKTPRIINLSHYITIKS